jgi:HKD family nuclease
MVRHESVPGPVFASGREALEAMAAEAIRLRAAVAFVTSTGVAVVDALRAQHPALALQVTARGAPMTEPQALLALHDLQVEVRVVCGSAAQAFHPKPWVADSEDHLHVLSGSGNLTAGGLMDNTEQFEYLTASRDESDVIREHEARLEGFESLGVPLTDVRGSPYWSEWERQTNRRMEIAEEERALDERLADHADSAALDADLYTDLNELYERAKAEVRIPDSRGGDRPYVASRFKQALERARAEGGGYVPLWREW